jgi:DNA protecting protein DprA
MASQVDPVAWWAPHVAAGVGVTWMGAPDYPRALADDPAPPGVLFWIGDLAWLQARRVALVGTRRASPDGRRVAYELGRDLAAAGVCVISGLALGIDGAAHAGALAAVKDDPDAVAPVAVVASGVDQPYPPQHRRLWDEVGRFGAIVSETLPGRRAEAWRFPVRNRIIAGLSQMVVIVESHAAGGSLITAEAALARGIEVRAVPGSIHNPASAGSNQLLYDGPGPVRSAQDVLDGLGVFLPARPTVRPAGRSPRPGSARTNAKAGSARPGESGRDVDDRPTNQPGRAGPHRRPASGPTQPTGQPTDAGLRAGPIEGGQDGSAAAGWSDDPTIRQVLEAIDWQPTSLGQIADRCPLAVPRVMAALDRLERLGWAARERQWWVRTVTSP